MSMILFTETLDLACGAFLLTAIATLWLRDLAAIVRLATAQAVVLSVISVLVGVQTENAGLFAIALVIFLLNGVLTPAGLGRLLRGQSSVTALPLGQSSVTALPLVNVPASMVAAVVLTLLAYAVSRPVVGLVPAETTRVIPLALAVVFVGFFAVITRRPALAQAVGVLLLCNGVMATALLSTGSAAVVTMTVTLDLLLWIVLLTIGDRTEFDGAEPDTLRQLRD
ncbi:MAG: hypothetical protein WAW17_21890 [Rhodococcus sp. (in: high G+C Gram-positive bacteria)]|uniref:hypothetical protein n=1 Tax=Rhodococcus sp. TaxID=1831 RepID=UPI003BAF9AA9